MECAWDKLLMILPVWLAEAADREKDSLRELRLYMGLPPVLIGGDPGRRTARTVTRGDLQTVINLASRYSPWASNLSQGFLTAPGGHRIGVAGEVVEKEGRITGFREITSLCLRVARDFPGIGAGVPLTDSLLILGPPGSGKTTLLRDLARRVGAAVVDSRGELFPEGVSRGNGVDVLSGCPKAPGIDMAVRTLSPEWLALDEITAEAEAMLQAVGCGVRLLATAHAESREDLFRRPAYRKLVEHKVFQTLVIMNRDRSFRTERMTSWNTNGSVQY